VAGCGRGRSVAGERALRCASARGGKRIGARFSVEPSSIRVPLRLWLESKVRSAVVASWVLARLSPLCIGLIHEGRDYRGDPAGLARLIDTWTTDLPDGTPSDPPTDPPRDDDGGAGVGARVKKKPPTIDGARLP
jgi:hypothetical protein